MTFSLSLYAMLPLVIQAIYFRLELGDLEDGEPPEGSKICHH